MSGNVCIMVLLNDMMPQFSVFEDIDLTVEHENPSLSDHSVLLTMPLPLSFQSSLAAFTTDSSCTSSLTLC
jgi:hypothetical protein